jgi:hypothetical protein
MEFTLGMIIQLLLWHDMMIWAMSSPRWLLGYIKRLSFKYQLDPASPEIGSETSKFSAAHRYHR